MRSFFVILSCSLLFLSTYSCKKGDNDPFLSLKSRKARLHGDWELQEYQYEEQTTSSSGDYQKITENLSNNQITQITQEYIDISATSVYDTLLITLTNVSYSFDKKGTWSRIYNTTEISIDDYIDLGTTWHNTYTTTKELSESGDWSFVGKLKDEYKNKERIVLNKLESIEGQQITSHIYGISTTDTTDVLTNGDHSSTTTTYISGEQSTILDVDRLKKKEIIFKISRQNTGQMSVTPFQGVPTISDQDDYNSESTLTLSRKD